MNDVLIGNACSLCAMVTDSVSATRKKHSQILGIQILSQIFYSAGSIILKGYSSTVQSGVAIVRNLAAMKNVKSKAVEWILILAGVVLGIVFNNRGLLGWLPIVANFEYSVAVFKFKDNERGLKLSFLINMAMYCVFSVFIKNYVGAAANLVTAIMTAIALIKGKKAAAEENADPEAPAELEEEA
jgi:hypothetical protein